MKSVAVLLLFSFAVYCGIRLTGNPDNPGCGNISLFSSLSDYRLVCGEEYTGNNKVVQSGIDNSKMAKQLTQWEATSYDRNWKPQ